MLLLYAFTVVDYLLLTFNRYVMHILACYKYRNVILMNKMYHHHFYVVDYLM